MKSFVNAKGITHLYALIAAAVGSFLVSPAGQAVLMQYPHLASVISAISIILALYHNPSKSS
jgi:hypothetical protein